MYHSVHIRPRRRTVPIKFHLQWPCSLTSDFIFFIYTSYLLLSPDIVWTCLFLLHRTAAKQSPKALFFPKTNWPRPSTLRIAYVMSFQSQPVALVYSIYGAHKMHTLILCGKLISGFACLWKKHLCNHFITTLQPNQPVLGIYRARNGTGSDILPI